MPSSQARLLTSHHRRELALVATAVVNRVEADARRVDLVDIDAWWDQQGPQLSSLVSAGYKVAATLAGRYLRQHAATEGALISAELAEAPLAKIDTSLLVTGPVAFKQNLRVTGDELVARRAMITRLKGSTTRLVMAGSRDTATMTAAASDRIVGWRRVTASKPCAFCAMLATRGAVYKSQSALRRPQFHDHDRCTYEPLYVNEPEPAEVKRLRRSWDEVTDGLSGTQALNAFRVHLDSV